MRMRLNKKYIAYILTVVLFMQLLPTKVFAVTEKTKAKNWDEYTLLSTSNSPLEIKSSEVNIKGDVHTNGDFTFLGIKLNIDGLCEAVEKINTKGLKNKISNKVNNSEKVIVPDFVTGIKEKISKDAEKIEGNKKIKDMGIKVDKPLVVNGGLSFSGLSLNVKSNIVAEKDINIKVGKLNQDVSNEIVICSSDGNININGCKANINGIIYAPKGTVTINATSFTLKGKIIANKIIYRGCSLNILDNKNYSNLISNSEITNDSEIKNGSEEINGSDLISSLDLIINRKFGVPHLQWKKVDGATYQVKRGTTCDDLKIIADNVSATFYDDDTTDMKAKYFYSVTAIKSGMKAVDSNIAELAVFIDSDGDGICDEDEVRFKTAPDKADTDGDGLLDGEEVEMYLTDPLKVDTDGDGLTDYVEVQAKSDKLNPLKADTDNNGIVDGEEDFDNDGLNNINEVKNKTDMFIADTDKDGISDSKEVNDYKTDPTQYDTDGDKLGDMAEIQRGTNPVNPDTNGNGILDGDEYYQQIIKPTLSVEPSAENGNILKNIKISFDATGEAKENTTISNLYGVDIKSSNVSGLIGYPINIETISKFTNADISFNYDPTLLKSSSPDNLAVLWYDMKNDKYVQMPVKLDKPNNVLTINTKDFGTYLIVDMSVWNESLKKESTTIDKGNQIKNRTLKRSPNNMVSDGSKINNDSYVQLVSKINNTIELAGYEYDSAKDIYITRMNPSQRIYGYTRLYDELAILGGMIIDCEPIYFPYANKNWMIELWKGQYDFPTGCEVGIYNEKWGLPIENGFYQCISDEVIMDIHYKFYKRAKGKDILIAERGQEKHWWLTTFKIGEFAETSQLYMDIDITLKDEAMAKAFCQGLEKANYYSAKGDYSIAGNTVSLKFDKPHTKQPYTRTDFIERTHQWKNKAMCDKYQEIKARLSANEVKLGHKELNDSPESIARIVQYYPKLGKELDDLRRLNSIDFYKNPK